MEIKKGDVVMSLDPKRFSDVFYDVVEVVSLKTDTGLWMSLRGKSNGVLDSWPLLMSVPKFVLVPKTTVEVLFGANKNGNKEKPSKNNAKSLRRKDKQRTSKKL
jgi:hypothetical protein